MAKSKTEIELFADKLDYLLSLHPTIHTREALARALGVKANTISTWGANSDSEEVAEVPDYAVQKLCDIFFLSPEVLQLRDFNAFKSALYSNPLRVNRWETRASVARAEAVFGGMRASIRLFAKTELSNARGTIDPDEASAAVRVAAGGYLRVEVLGPEGWHVLLVERRPFGWAVRRPSAAISDPVIKQGKFYYPSADRSNFPRFAQVDGPSGEHRFVAVLTEDPVEPGILSAIASQDSMMAALDRLTVYLKRFGNHLVVGESYTVNV